MAKSDNPRRSPPLKIPMSFEKAIDVLLSVDPKKLQEWATRIIGKHDVGFELAIEELPTFLKITNGPSSAFISYCDKGGKALFICWGGGFGHWGLIVGDSTCIVENRYPDRPVLSWVPGVYFFTQ